MNEEKGKITFLLLEVWKEQPAYFDRVECLYRKPGIPWVLGDAVEEWTVGDQHIIAFEKRTVENGKEWLYGTYGSVMATRGVTAKGKKTSFVFLACAESIDVLVDDYKKTELKVLAIQHLEEAVDMCIKQGLAKELSVKLKVATAMRKELLAQAEISILSREQRQSILEKHI